MSDEGVPPEGGFPDDQFPSDEEADAWLEEWAEADREAAGFLREHLQGLDLRVPGPDVDDATTRLRGDLKSRSREATYLRRANGWAGGLPEDHDAWLQALGSTISPPEDPGTSAEEQSCVAALQHVDWLGLVLGLVRRGVGARLVAKTVLRDIVGLEDVDGEIEDPEGLLSVLEMAVEVLTPLWTYLGVLDDDRRLTQLGRWGLPTALARTWDPLPAPRPPRLEPDVRQAALDILAEGPRSLEDLRKALAKRKTIVSVDDLHADLIAHPEIWVFGDDTFGHLPTLSRDVVVTHQLTAAEKQVGMLALGTDLDFWVMHTDAGCSLAGGGAVSLRYRGHGYDVPGDDVHALEGPEGWLDDFAPGDLVGLRYVDGELRVESADPPPDENEVYDQDVSYADEVAALATIIEEAVAYDEEYGDPTAPGVSGAEIVHRMRRAHPQSLRRPLPPLGALAEALGYGLVNGYVGRPGATWGEQAPSWFSDEQADAWSRWRAATARWRQRQDVPADELDELARELDACALLGFVSPDVIADPDLDGFLEAMEQVLEGPLLAVPRLLRASAAEARGDMTAYRALLDAVLDADPDNREALVDVADLHAIAGEAREADRLYRLAGLPADSDEIRTLQPFLQPPADGPGRNRPCPCGSGKKYKVCHGRTAVHPLEARASWLWTKLCMFAQRSPQRADMLEWGAVLAGAEPDSPEAARQALGNPMVHDFAIGDGGLLHEFLAVMGDLLPADEMALAESWEGQPMRLLEVRRVLPMRGIVAADLLTHEELEVADRRLSREVETHDVLLGRPLDDGSGTLRLQSAPAAVPRLHRARLLELLRAGGSPRELAAAVFAPSPPTVQTTDGEELVLSTARYDESTVPLDVDSLGQQPPAPDDPADNPADDAADDPADDFWNAPVAPDELTPEDFEIIARKYEERWLGDSIPALGGETPRQAATSSRRDDLVALLDDFEWAQRRAPTPFDMDVARLRRELGIEG